MVDIEHVPPSWGDILASPRTPMRHAIPGLPNTPGLVAWWIDERLGSIEVTDDLKDWGAARVDSRLARWADIAWFSAPSIAAALLLHRNLLSEQRPPLNLP